MRRSKASIEEEHYIDFCAKVYETVTDQDPNRPAEIYIRTDNGLAFKRTTLGNAKAWANYFERKKRFSVAYIKIFSTKHKE